MSVAQRPDWERVRSLFVACLRLPPGEREAWLADACADQPELLVQLTALLAAHGASDNLLDGDGEAFVARLINPLDPDSPRSADRSGECFGVYTIVRLLGEGGMGSVFLAERSDGQFQQQVALKLIRDNFATRQQRERFLRERQILARLKHPHIAQLHDGGLAADGAPYFTLEYVDGAPITRYCDQRGLTIEQRLRLLLDVCDAVQYAHRNLIVHRDLKPSNILVTDGGQVKLLDFGIAKLLDDSDGSQTETHSRVMTREYAAPEQVLSQPITTATDVYALGVLIYESLCGRLPYARAERGEVSWPKAIVEEQPEPLTHALFRRQPANDARAEHSTAVAARGAPLLRLRNILRGDLERIVQRALEKVPEARYPSVTALADDVRAHLEGRALPGGGRRYRLAKFLRRHRVGVATSAVFLLIASVGVAGILYQARETQRQARTVTAVKDFLVSLFNASNPNEAKGSDLSVRELLDRGTTRIEHGLAAQPQLRAELQSVLGRIYFQLGLYEQAQTLGENALAAFNNEGSEPAATALAQSQLAETLAARGDFARAELLAAKASDLLQASGNDPGERINSWIARSGIAQKDGKSLLAEDFAKHAVQLAREPGTPKELLGNALSAQGMAEWDLRNVAESEVLYREALQIHRDAFGDLDLRVARDRQNLTLSLRNLGRYDEALEQARDSVAIRERILGPQHPDMGWALLTLGTTLYHMARYEEAERALRRSVAVARASVGDNNIATATALNGLGLVLIDWHDLDEAEQVYIEALRIFTAQLGPNHNSTIIAASNLGYVHSRQGKLEQSERELRDALERDRQAGIKDQVWELNRIGDVRRQRGDWKEAIVVHREALAQSKALFAPNARQAALSHYYLGLALVDGGQSDEAETELRASLAAFRVLIAPDGAHPFSASARLALGKLLATQPESHDEGLRLIHEAVALRQRFLGNDDPRTQEARDALAK
jgi:eukaryotic-like serine/threonine-protein kinase